MPRDLNYQTVGDRLSQLWHEEREMEREIENLKGCLEENRREAATLVAKPMDARVSKPPATEV